MEPARALVILDQFLSTGGTNGPNAFADVGGAMTTIMSYATRDRGWRRQFASLSLFERTLNPASIKPSTFVSSSTQAKMLDPLYASLTGGIWFEPDPTGITSWIGSEDGGRHYFVQTLVGRPHVIAGHEIELAFEVLAPLLKIVRDAALPISWFAALMDAEAFKKLEARISAGEYTTLRRRALLALNAQAAGRVVTELAKLATGKPGAFPSFPAGDGRATPTTPPPAKAWHRSGWTWLAAAGGLIGGGLAAGR